MLGITRKFVASALESGSIWDVGNQALYKLCEENPGHSADNVIIAKIWLIGRAYAAAVERRRVKGDFSGDDFYEKYIAPRIRRANIDDWFKSLEEKTNDDGAVSLAIHKKFTDLLGNLTGQQKRSLGPVRI